MPHIRARARVRVEDAMRRAHRGRRGRAHGMEANTGRMYVQVLYIYIYIYVRVCVYSVCWCGVVWCCAICVYSVM